MLTPITKDMGTTFVGGPGTGRTRRECWGATSKDGLWGYQRAEDVGTQWYVIHLPTNWTLIGPHGTLRSARQDTADGTALLALWRDAHRELALPEHGIGKVTNHDRARAVLTWLVEHEPRSVQIVERETEAQRLRELAGRLRAIIADLDIEFDRLMRTDDPWSRLIAVRPWALRVEYEALATTTHIAAANAAAAARDMRSADKAERMQRAQAR